MPRASHPALRPGGAAAFSEDAEGEERLVLAVEVERRSGVEPGERGLAVVSGLLVGVAPALRASPLRLAAALRSGISRASLSPASLRLRSTLIVAQVAVSFVLVLGAGLLLRSLYNLRRVDPGFRSASVEVMEVQLPVTRYKQWPQRLDFFQRLSNSLRNIPGVLSVAVSNGVPLTGRSFTTDLAIEGQVQDKGELLRVSFHNASRDYFATLGIPILLGRGIAESDNADTIPVAVIDRSMQRRYWPNVSPLGKRFTITFAGMEKPWTVVGVVGDVKHSGLNADDGPSFYIPFSQFSAGGNGFVRTASNPDLLVRNLRPAVHAIDPDVPVVSVQPLEQVKAEWIAPSRLTATLVGLFAALAAVIAALGIGSVVAFAVAERTQEIGIHAALGATPNEILRLILGRILILLAAGLALGGLGSLWLAHVLASLLFGVTPNDPATLAAVGAVLIAVFVLSALVPARRATRIEPLLALRA